MTLRVVLVGSYLIFVWLPSSHSKSDSFFSTFALHSILDLLHFSLYTDGMAGRLAGLVSSIMLLRHRAALSRRCCPVGREKDTCPFCVLRPICPYDVSGDGERTLCKHFKLTPGPAPPPRRSASCEGFAFLLSLFVHRWLQDPCFESASDGCWWRVLMQVTNKRVKRAM